MSLAEEKFSYTLSRVQLQAAKKVHGTNRWIDVDYYRPHGTNRVPIIMVLPMLGGGYELEKHFAGYFASHGYAAAIVRRDRRQKQMKVEELDILMRQMVLDHRQVVDWFESRPELDSARLGIFGVSMGGIKGAILIALESRIKAAALGLTGGDLPFIISHTTEAGLVRRREQELKERNMTVEQSEEQLRRIITCDPITYASYVDPRKVMLVLANNDTVVPIAKGIELKEKMKNPETIFIPGGHYSAILAIPYIKSQSMAFFEKRFNEAASSATGVASRGLVGRRK
jgi:cephalosporin-C deacetylase-like acetyl esterase